MPSDQPFLPRYLVKSSFGTCFAHGATIRESDGLQFARFVYRLPRVLDIMPPFSLASGLLGLLPVLKSFGFAARCFLRPFFATPGMKSAASLRQSASCIYLYIYIYIMLQHDQSKEDPTRCFSRHAAAQFLLSSSSFFVFL